MVFFRLHESPRFLVHAGRPQDAIKSLQMISKFNGSEISIELEDVRDHLHPSEAESSPQKLNTRSRATSRTVFDASVIEDRPSSPTRSGSNESIRATRTGPGAGSLVTAYSSTGETAQVLDSHTFYTPTAEIFPTLPGTEDAGDSEIKDSPVSAAVDQHDDDLVEAIRRRRLSTASRRSSMYEQRVCRCLPRWIRRPLWAWWDRVMMVLAPEWIRTTVLVWSAWCLMSLGTLTSCYALIIPRCASNLLVVHSIYHV